eukprot:8922477-Alexandrium_andersonii.AAC.1
MGRTPRVLAHEMSARGVADRATASTDDGQRSAAASVPRGPKMSQRARPASSTAQPPPSSAPTPARPTARNSHAQRNAAAHAAHGIRHDGKKGRAGGGPRGGTT